MIALAGTFALAASMLLAGLRLRIESDKVHGRSFVIITPAFRVYVLLHGLAALLPFPFHQFWGTKWNTLFTISPWAVAFTIPLLVNQMLKLQGLDLPKATTRLAKFRDQILLYMKERMFDQEFAAMREFIAPYATEDMSVVKVRMLAMLHHPAQLTADKKEALRVALDRAQSVESAMELYIRHIGRASFCSVFRKNEESMARAQTPLFDELERKRHARLTGAGAAMSA
jgi:hypothetical protein